VTPPQYLDTLGIGVATAELPEQITETLITTAELLAETNLPPGASVRSVGMVGMGASGLAGDAAQAYAFSRASLPVWVSHGYEVPEFVGPGSLVFAASWSGQTEETLSAATAAVERGATVVVITGGGALADVAGSAGLTRFSVPAGLPAARTALGAMVIPILMTLSHLEILPDATPSLRAASTALSRRRDALVAAPGPAEEVARGIGRTIPLIYGSSGLGAIAARRWKSQINVNAKTPAFVAVAPELSHNEVAGWGQHGDMTRQVLTLVTLRESGELPGVTRRLELANEVTDEVMANLINVWAEGDDELGHFFDHAYFGDFVSLHLAGREEIDPGPAPAVEALRAVPS
jgi:glucose/mannose-6-phosphate isomerase